MPYCVSEKVEETSLHIDLILFVRRGLLYCERKQDKLENNFLYILLCDMYCCPYKKKLFCKCNDNIFFLY